VADSEALRSRRKRAHAAGDHRLCRRCAAVKERPGRGGYGAGGRTVQELPPPPASVSVAAAEVNDPVAELRQLAAQLAQAYQSEPGNALLARELRMTLQALMPAKAGNRDDDLSDLFAEFGGS
jgi:hypothetical protein